jgi:hypothetical protein
MKKELLNELNQMKYLFGYKPGRVISEQEINEAEMEMSDVEFDFPEVAPAPDKEKTKGDGLMYIWIGGLFKRQFNITSNRLTTRFKSTSIGRFHNTGTTTSHGNKTQFGNFLTYFSGLLIIRMAFFKSGRSKYGDAWAHKIKRSKPFYKFKEYLNSKFKLLQSWPRTV